MDELELIECAIRARENAYAPYSNYMVGAAVYTKDGRIFTGCNIENASYGATNCAERTAVFKAVSEGDTQICAIAIVGGSSGKELDYAFPCGICRQVLREFSNPSEFTIIVARTATDYKRYTLDDLLPNSFGPEFLQ